MSNPFSLLQPDNESANNDNTKKSQKNWTKRSNDSDSNTTAKPETIEASDDGKGKNNNRGNNKRSKGRGRGSDSRGRGGGDVRGRNDRGRGGADVRQGRSEWKSKSYGGGTSQGKPDSWRTKSFDKIESDKIDEGNNEEKEDRYKALYSSIDLLQFHSPNYPSPSFKPCSLPVWSEETISPYSYTPKNKTEIINLAKSLTKQGVTNWKTNEHNANIWKYPKREEKPFENAEPAKEPVQEKVVVPEETVSEPEVVQEPVPEPVVETRKPSEIIPEDVANMPNWHEEKFWFYKAPATSELHGPFNAVKMDKWMVKGFFNVTLEVQYKNSVFENLGDIFIDMKRNPFTQESLDIWIKKPNLFKLKQNLPGYIIATRGKNTLNQLLGVTLPTQQQQHVPQQMPPQHVQMQSQHIPQQIPQQMPPMQQQIPPQHMKQQIPPQRMQQQIPPQHMQQMPPMQKQMPPQHKPQVQKISEPIDPTQLFPQSQPQQPQQLPKFSTFWSVDKTRLQEMQLVMARQHNELMSQYGHEELLFRSEKNRSNNQQPKQRQNDLYQSNPSASIWD